MELPAGRKLTALPGDAAIQTANLNYVSQWSQSGQTVTLHREFTSSIKEAVCTAKNCPEIAAALAKIRDDEQTPLTLAD